MSPQRKKEGFEGQRAIILPRKVLALQCGANPLIRHSYITDIGYYPRALHHYRERHVGIDQNILIYCVEGRGWMQINNVRQTISPGNFFVVPARTAHTYASERDLPWTIYWMHIKGVTADAMVDRLITQLRGYRGMVKHSPRRISLFEEIYSTLERGYSNDQILYANLCLGHFFGSFQFDDKFDLTQKPAQRDIAATAIDFMQENIARPLTLAELASSVNLSPSHFIALFHKKTGFAPVEYFNHLKIQKASQYLQFTDELIKEISYEIGIDDSYYFSRLFKKLMGVSPLQYRKRFRLSK